jgi:hypothetical protein
LSFSFTGLNELSLSWSEVRNKRFRANQKINQPLCITWIKSLRFKEFLILSLGKALTIYLASGWCVQSGNLSNFGSEEECINRILINLGMSSLVNHWWVLEITENLDLFVSSHLPEGMIAL